MPLPPEWEAYTPPPKPRRPRGQVDHLAPIRRRRRLKTAGIFAGAGLLTFGAGFALTNGLPFPRQTPDSEVSKPDVESCSILDSGCRRKEIESGDSGADSARRYRPETRPDRPPEQQQDAADRGATRTNRFTCTVTGVHDGDGPIYCAEGPKIRLTAIAARELDETCNPGHPCPNASGAEAQAELERLAGGQVLSCEQTGTSYSRVTAWCWRPDGVELNCAMVRSGKAMPWPKFDPGGLMCS